MTNRREKTSLITVREARRSTERFGVFFPQGSPQIVYHPDERSLWFWSETDVVRLVDGRLTAVAKDATPYTRYVTERLAYFDTHRKCPTLVLASYSQEIGCQGILIADWNGTSFVARQQANTVDVSTRDRFAYDGDRGVLVHISQGDSPRIRELAADGTWRDIAVDVQSSELAVAAWFPLVAQILFFDLEARTGYLWNGQALTKYARLPGGASPSWIAPDASGSLVFQQDDESGKVWVCGPGSITALERTGLESAQGAVFDAARGELLLYQAEIHENPPCELAALREGRCVPLEQSAAPVLASHITSEGPVRGCLDLYVAREATDERRLYSLGADLELAAWSPAMTSAPVAVARLGEAYFAFAADGAVETWAPGREGWSTVSAGRGPSVLDDPLVVGIDPDGSSVALVANKKLWIFDGTRWSSLAGKLPFSTPVSAVCWFGSKSERILLVGADKKGRLVLAERQPSGEWQSSPLEVAEETTSGLFLSCEYGWAARDQSAFLVVVSQGENWWLRHERGGVTRLVARQDAATTLAPGNVHEVRAQTLFSGASSYSFVEWDIADLVAFSPPPAQPRAPARAPRNLQPYVMSTASKGPDLLGGDPPGFPAESWPVCARCRKPMTHIATLYADAKRLPLRHGAVSLFCCQGADWCGEEGASAVVLHSTEESNPKPSGKATSVAHPEPLRAQHIKYAKASKARIEGRDDAQSFLGHEPQWLQGEAAPPVCPTCGHAMDFIAQLDEELDPTATLNFAQGAAFVWICREEHAGFMTFQSA